MACMHTFSIFNSASSRATFANAIQFNWRMAHLLYTIVWNIEKIYMQSQTCANTKSSITRPLRASTGSVIMHKRSLSTTLRIQWTLHIIPASMLCMLCFSSSALDDCDCANPVACIRCVADPVYIDNIWQSRKFAVHLPVCTLGMQVSGRASRGYVIPSCQIGPT